MSDKPIVFPPQSQDAGAGHPGLKYKMTPEPEFIRFDYKGTDKLKGKVAPITGGDSGIGRAPWPGILLWKGPTWPFATSPPSSRVLKRCRSWCRPMAAAAYCCLVT